MASLLLAHSAAGCVALGAGRGDPRERRAALGHLAEDGGTLERVEEIAKLERELGNDELAIGAARTLLERAEVEVARAIVEGSDPAKARAELDEAVRFCVALGRDLDEPSFVLETAARAQHPRRHRRHIEWALLARDARATRAHLGALEAAVRRKSARAALRWNPWADSDESTEVDERRLAPERLRQTFAVALHHDDAARAARLARVVLEHDRLDVSARLIASADSSELPQVVAAVSELERGTWSEAPLARLELLRSETESPLVSLAYAAALLERHLAGDARQIVLELVEKVGHDGLGRERAAVADQLLAMAALTLGDDAAFHAWSKRAGARRSAHLAKFVHALETLQPPDGVTARARAIRVRAAKGRVRGLEANALSSMAKRTALEDDGSARLKRRAIATVRRHGAWDLALVEHCRSASLSMDACEALDDRWWVLRDADEGLEPESIDLLDELGPSAFEDPQWLWGVALSEIEVLRALRSRLQPRIGTAVGLTPAFQEAWLITNVVHGAAALRDALAQVTLIDADVRARMALALVDLEHGFTPQEVLEALRSGYEFPITATLQAGPMPAHDPGMVTDLHPGNALSVRLARGLALAHHGRFQLALAELDAVVAAAPPGVRPELLGHLGTTAAAAGNLELARACAMKLDEEAPDSFAAWVVRGRIAMATDDAKLARQAYGHALSLRPDRLALRSAWLDAAARVGVPELPRLLEVVELLDGPQALALTRAVERGHIRTTGELVRARAAWAGWTEIDTASERSLGLASLDNSIVQALIGETLEASTPDRAMAVARRGVAYLKTVDEPFVHRSAWAWWNLLLGEIDELQRIATAEVTTPSWATPLSPDDTTLLMAAVRRAKRLDVEGVRALWRAERTYEVDAAIGERLAPLADDPGVTAYLCTHHVQLEQVEAADAACRRAIEHPGPWIHPWINAAYLVIEHEDRISYDGEAVFGRDDRPAALSENAAWNVNLAAWALRGGELEAAARAHLRAVGLGHRFDEAVGPEDLRQMPWRGRVIRARTAAFSEQPAPRMFTQLAMHALRGGDLEAARSYGRAALRWGIDHADDPGLAQTAVVAVDGAELLAHDLQTNALALGDIGNALDAATQGEEVLETLAQRHPRSSFIGTLQLQSKEWDGDAHALAKRLVERFPENPLVVASAVPALVKHGEKAKASAVLARARAAHPEHPLLRDDRAFGDILLAHPDLPTWLRSPTRFRERLAAVDEQDIVALDPQRRFDVTDGVEAFFPASWPAQGKRRVSASRDEAMQVTVIEEARASRCDLPECARLMATAMRDSGFSSVWKGSVRTPIGPAVDMLFSGAGSLVAVRVHAIGGHIFYVSGAAPSERFEALLPALRLAHESIRPMDFVMPAMAAELSRVSGSARPPDALRLRARRELARHASATTCGIPRSLRTLADEATRAELLLDLYLATQQVGKRKALLRCAAPERTTGARLALAALLDDDPQVHAFGRRAVAAHPQRVVDDAKQVMSARGERISAQDFSKRSSGAPKRGWLEVLGALPEAERRAAWLDLSRAEERSSRTMAFAYAALARDDGLQSLLAERLTDADDGDAALIVQALHDPTRARVRERLLDRARRLEAIDDPSRRRLAVVLAEGLARALEPGDRRLLTRLLDNVRVGESKAFEADAIATRDQLGSVLDDHRDAIALRRGRTVESASSRARRWSEPRVDSAAATVRSDDDLVARSLVELAPGPDWAYGRLSDPALFTATVRALLTRLPQRDSVQSRVVLELVGGWMDGFALLQSAGGLRLDRPIECVSRTVYRDHACVASIRDHRAVRMALARSGGDGLQLPITGTVVAGVVPPMLSAIPFLVHAALGDRETGRPANPQLSFEVARSEQRIAGRALERIDRVTVRDRDLEVQSHYHLVVGDRLFVFSDAAIAASLLTQPDSKERLVDSEELAQLTSRWSEGTAIQAVMPASSGVIPGHGLATEIAVDGQGLSFRYRTQVSAEHASHGRLHALLPPGSAAHLVFALPLGLGGELELDERTGFGTMPPAWLGRTNGVAFGWYPEVGKPLWDGWLAAVPNDEATRRELRRAGARLPAQGSVDEREGLVLAVRPEAVLVSSRRTLIDQALAIPAETVAAAPVRMAAGHLEAGRTVAALESILPANEPIALALAAGLGILEHTSFTADWTPATGELLVDGNLHVAVTDDAASLELVDRWLSSSVLANATRLPRRPSKRDLARPMRYVLETDDARRFVDRAVLSSDRTTARVLDERRVELVVRPESGGSVHALSDEARRDSLADDHRFALRNRELLAIRDSLVKPDMKPAEIADAVTKWVGENLDYRLNPESITVSQILAERAGDCTEYSQLTVALLRASGIPARERGGMAVSGEELVAHAWVAWHDGERWHEIDPTFTGHLVTAGHLELSVVEILGLLSLGRLRIIEAAPVSRAK